MSEIEYNDKSYTENNIDKMFEDIHNDFKTNHPIAYWFDKHFDWIKLGYSPHHIVTHPWLLIEDLFREIKCAYQRVVRKWDYRVIWSIDYHLSEFIPIWIEELKHKQVGVSGEFFEGLPYDDDGYGYSEESMNIARDRMFVVLDKISDGFRAYKEMTDVYDKDKIDILKKRFDEGFELFHRYYHILND